jgi:GT2 family glycosyltransferase
MTTNTPRVGVIIVTYKNTSNVLDLVGDLAGQSVPPHEIFVIDNGASEEARSVMANKFPDVRYVLMSENTGSAGGYREGLRLASIDNDYVFTLDDDLRLVPDAIEKLLAGFEAAEGHSNAAIIAGWESLFAKDYYIAGSKASYSFSQLKKYPELAWRGKLFLSDAVKKSGLPRDNYFLYGDDTEYSLRLGSLGYTFYVIPDFTFYDNRSSNKAELPLIFTSTPIYYDDFRTYYALRNEMSIRLEYKQYLKAAKVIGHAIKLAIGFMLQLRSFQKAHIKAIFDGIYDGIQSRLGKNISYLPEHK